MTGKGDQPAEPANRPAAPGRSNAPVGRNEPVRMNEPATNTNFGRIQEFDPETMAWENYELQLCFFF